jgi:hypothetical protein
MLSNTNCKCKRDAMATEPLLKAARHPPFETPRDPVLFLAQHARSQPARLTIYRPPDAAALFYTAGIRQRYKLALISRARHYYRDARDASPSRPATSDLMIRPCRPWRRSRRAIADAFSMRSTPDEMPRLDELPASSKMPRPRDGPCMALNGAAVWARSDEPPLFWMLWDLVWMLRDLGDAENTKPTSQPSGQICRLSALFPTSIRMSTFST